MARRNPSRRPRLQNPPAPAGRPGRQPGRRPPVGQPPGRRPARPQAPVAARIQYAPGQPNVLRLLLWHHQRPLLVAVPGAPLQPAIQQPPFGAMVEYSQNALDAQGRLTGDQPAWDLIVEQMTPNVDTGDDRLSGYDT